MKTKIAYVLVSSHKDLFWEQCLISVMSVRHHMPDAHTVLVCDTETKESLNDGPDKNVLRCFEYFYNRLKSETIEKVHLIKNRILSTNYIDITATTEEDSYTIFL